MANDLITYGGVEVVNTERLQAYLSNGLMPAGASVTVDSCDGLAEAVGGPSWAPYTTPIGDEPPWYDGNDPDTWDFAGVYALEVTGLHDTNRTVTIDRTVRGTGIPGAVSRGPQTIGVTALLVGRTTEGVLAGLAWLRKVLHGSCDADERPCGPAADLTTFIACPGPLTATPDLDAPVTTEEMHPYDVAGDPSLWYVANGAFTDAGDGTSVIPYEADSDVIDGDTASPSGSSDVITADASTVEPIIIGGASTALGQSIVGVLTFSTCDRPGGLTVTWRMRSLTDAYTTAQLFILGADYLPLIEGPTVVVTDTMTDYTWDLPEGINSDDPWHLGLILATPVVIESVTLDGHLPLAPEKCAAPYRRRFPQTATVSGPTPAETIDTGCVELLTVEWVWVCSSPYRYGDAVPVMLGLGWGEAPTLEAPGVSHYVGIPPVVIDASPWNCSAPAGVSECAIDPAAPTFGVPPALPVITDTSRPRITTQNVRDMWALVGPEQIPANEGVFTIVLTAGAEPVVGLRVRVWDNAETDGSVPDECAFVYEYLIDYIPANGVMTIDGAAGTITTLCGGLSVPQDATPNVRGNFGGPLEPAVVRCDRRYLVRAQWLSTYPRSAAGFYTSGDPNGDVTMDLYVSTREG